MALNEDSRSLLQLMLARGKSYGDIAGLLGVDESEVRTRARSALTEIAGSDCDASLTDYLLGQADPIGRAETARALSEDPVARETASDISAQLRLLVPGASLPEIGSTAISPSGQSRKLRGSSRPGEDLVGSKARGSARTGLMAGLSMAQRRLLAVLLLAAILIAVVLLVVSPGGSEGGGEGESGEERPAATTAVLSPVEGESGSGVVNFGFSGTELAAQLQFSDLQPTEKGKSYVVWLYGPGGSFPVNQARVDEAGAIAGQVAINQALICFIAGDLFPEMRLSRVDDTEMRNALQQARNAGSNAELPEFVGEPVLEGPISMPQEAKDEILPVCNR
jgi:hypothetical protein